MNPAQQVGFLSDDVYGSLSDYLPGLNWNIQIWKEIREPVVGELSQLWRLLAEGISSESWRYLYESCTGTDERSQGRRLRPVRVLPLPPCTPPDGNLQACAPGNNASSAIRAHVIAKSSLASVAKVEVCI